MHISGDRDREPHVTKNYSSFMSIFNHYHFRGDETEIVKKNIPTKMQESNK